MNGKPRSLARVSVILFPAIRLTSLRGPTPRHYVMSPELESLEKKIAALEGQVFSLRSELEKAKRGTPPVVATKAEAQPVTAKQAAPPQTTLTATASPAPAARPKEAPAVQPAAATVNDAGFSWEWLIGGNIIGKIGIVTLIVSTALFMVYALDQGWLSEWIRLLMLQAAFGALSYLSYRLYVKNYKVIPEILAITALAANIIAIYSAHFVYRFLGRTETMAMMALLMAIALAFARRIQSTALTVILFAGFFALPVIHSRGINEPKAYFTYLLAVNLLYFLLQQFRSSPHTLWVLALGNALSLFGWAGAYRQYATTPLFFCAVTLVILLYNAHKSSWGQASPGAGDAMDGVRSTAGGFFRAAAVIFVNIVYAGMVSSVLSLNKDFSKEITALALLCQAAINFLVVQFLPGEKRSLSSATLIVILFMASGVSVIMDGPAERLVLAVLLTAAMFVAGKWPDPLVYYGAATVNLINLVALFVGLSHSSDRWFILNFQAGGFLFYAVAAIYMRAKTIWPQRFNFGIALTGVALVTSFIGIITELQRVVTTKDSRLLMITLVFAAYALTLLFIGFRWQKVWFRQAGLFFMGLAIAKFYFIDIWQWDKSVRIIAGIIMGGGLVLISFYYEKFRNKFKELGVILILGGFVLSSSPVEAVEKFKPNRFKFVKELSLKGELNGKTFGSVVVDADIYKSAGENDVRLAYDGKIVPYARQMKKSGDDKRMEKEITVADLVTSVDGENNSIFIFENRDNIRLSGLKLNFKEKDYTREILVYHRSGKFQPNVLAKSITLTRKAGKPEFHTVDFAPVSGEIQLQIRNEDDAALALTQFAAVSDKEFIIFRVPDNFADSDKKIQLYYSGEYSQKPKYDIADSLGEGTAYAEFALEAEKPNPQHKLTLFDPPYSIWLFRTVFWLLLALIAWRMFAIYKREKTSTAI